MPTVNFKINSKNYSVDCGVGQEAQILSIAEQIDAKAKSLSSMFGAVDSETLLLMVCILAFGDLAKAKNKITALEGEFVKLKDAFVDEDVLADMIMKIVAKIKAVSAKLDVDDMDNKNESSILQFR